MTKAILIPVEGPVEHIDLDGSLSQLQSLVGDGHIEAVPLPDFIPGSDGATAYINDEGKFRSDLKANMRATDFMVPGIGLFYGDYIVGPFLLTGFDPETGDTIDVPEGIVKRASLIEREAA